MRTSVLRSALADAMPGWTFRITQRAVLMTGPDGRTVIARRWRVAAYLATVGGWN